jgi:hypothetical protein
MDQGMTRFFMRVQKVLAEREKQSGALVTIELDRERLPGSWFHADQDLISSARSVGIEVTAGDKLICSLLD